jgi:hypothetical protein
MNQQNISTCGLPFDTPEAMVRMFKAQRSGASPEFRRVLDGLIEKWEGWHGTTFRYLWLGGSVRIVNFDELKRMVVML